MTTAFPSTPKAGDYWFVSTPGTIHDVILSIGDLIIARQNNPVNTNPAHYTFTEANRDVATNSVLGLVRIATVQNIQEGALGPFAVTASILSDYRTSSRLAILTRYNLGDGTNTSIDINIGSSVNASIQVFDSATREVVYPRIIHVSNTTIRFEFGFVPTVSQFYAIVSTT